MVTVQVESLRKVGLPSVNMDLIYGLPFQTPETFRTTIQSVIRLAPDRIALFNFAYVPKLKPHMKLIEPSAMPSPEQKFQILKETIESLTDAGYVFIGMDHFSKPDDSLTHAFRNNELHRNFQGYTTMAGLEMLGFGMSAISMLDRLYVQNVSNIPAYEDAVKAGNLATWRGCRLSKDDCLRRDIINHLMCRFVVDLDWIETETGESFDTYFPGVRSELDALVKDGLLNREGNLYRVTSMGRLLIRNVAMVFDKYLPAMIHDKKASFSRTV